MEANNSLPPTTSVFANGGIVPPAKGTGREAGVKLSLWDGKLTSTISWFKLDTDGLTVFGGTTPGGGPYVIPVGPLVQKGFDGDVALQFNKQWQLVGTFYSGTVKDFNGKPIDDSYTGSWSLFSRYSFADTALKGLSIGGGVSRITGRVVSTAGITYPTGQTKPTFINVAPATVVGLFATYDVNKNWNLRLQVDNALDENYAVGINAAYLIDTSLPRNFTFSAKYKF
jgi:iron complex outermembrane receptor protein